MTTKTTAAAVARIKARKPTGQVPWPLVLVEGPEKAGKSYTAALFSACDKVGQTYWIDLGEGSADEYGAIPDARYLVVEHDGSWASLLEQVDAVREEAKRAADAGEPPVVLVVDSMTAEWDLLKDWASSRARGSKSNQEKLRKDPTAEVSVPMNLWNDATARHRRLMTLLLTFPGIVIVTARGKEVASLDDNGRPVEGSKTYKVEGHKSLAFDATVWVRMSRDHAPMVVGARSVHAGVRPGVDKPQTAPKFTLDWLIFDVLKCNPATAKPRDLTESKPHEDNPPEDQPERAAVPAKALDPRAEAWSTAWNAAKTLGMSREKFAEQFQAEFGVSEREGTAEQFTTYGQQLQMSLDAEAETAATG